MAVALLAPILLHLPPASLQLGEVASQDVLAPLAITYTSNVLTEIRREAAERAVAPVYSPPDTGIARQQLERLRTALSYINNVRSDTYASSEQKLKDLGALDALKLAPETAAGLLDLSEGHWQAVQQESVRVLEQVMRTSIRPERLEDAQASIPMLISLSLPDAQAIQIEQLVSPFVVANSFLNETLTQAARQKARDAVGPVVEAFVPGESIISRGRVITAADVEAMEQVGLMRPRLRWQDVAGALLISGLMLALLGFYLRAKPAVSREPYSLMVISLLFLAFLFGGRMAFDTRSAFSYAYPLAAYTLIVSALFSTQPAVVSSLPLAILVGYGFPDSLEITLYYIMTGLFGAFALGRGRRIGSFFLAGLAVAFSGAVVLIVLRLPLLSTNWWDLGMVLGIPLLNGLATAALTLLLEVFAASGFRMATPMHLMELTRPDHPLLGMILQKAPGTYQHSLQLANLAEQAAERIGADPLLTRVGALYHDAGKALNPFCFIENQLPGFTNPHDEMDPLTSAQVIIRHVPDGYELVNKYRLPRLVCDFVVQHHGTMITQFQYHRALEAAGGDEGKVDIRKFRYPGPRPRSKETALLMLADGCEARVRAEAPKDEAALRKLIKEVIDNRVARRQLDETNLTLRDLDTILDSFTSTLRGFYHSRVKYPALESPGEQVPSLAPSSLDVSTNPLRSSQSSPSTAEARPAAALTPKKM